MNFLLFYFHKTCNRQLLRCRIHNHFLLVGNRPSYCKPGSENVVPKKENSRKLMSKAQPCHITKSRYCEDNRITMTHYSWPIMNLYKAMVTPFCDANAHANDDSHTSQNVGYYLVLRCAQIIEYFLSTCISRSNMNQLVQ